MDRKEMYAKVKEYDLAQKIQARYGNNYTRVSSKHLEEAIKEFEAQKAKKGTVKKNTPTKESCCCVKENALVKLLSILAAKGIIIPEEAEMVAKLL